MIGQREKLERELEHLKKTYRSGIVSEKEFLKGKERIDRKLSEIDEKEKREQEGKKIIMDIIDDKKQKEDKQKPEKQAAEKKAAEKPGEKHEDRKAAGKAPGRAALVHGKPAVSGKEAEKGGKPDMRGPKELHEMPARKKHGDAGTVKEDGSPGFMAFAFYVAIVILIIVLLILLLSGRGPLHQGLSAGDAVSMEVYCDFSCSHCADLDRTLVDLKKAYGSNISIVQRHFLLDEDAYLPSAAAECANEQGRFNIYKSLMYRNQGALDESSLVKYAWQAGLDIEKFSLCLDDDSVKQKVISQSRDASAMGVEFTPTVFVGGRKIVGAADISVFSDEINRQLLD